MPTVRHCVALALVLAVALPLPSAAQSTRAEGGGSEQALRKAQALLRQAAQEASALQAENLKLLGEVDALESRLASARATLEETDGALGETRGRAAALASRLQGTEGRLATTEEQLRDVVVRYKALAAQHRELQQVRVRLDETVATGERDLAECTATNAELYEAGMELLARYERKGVWDALAQREPVTGLKQVDIENVLQEYADRLDDQRYVRPAAAGTPATPPP